MLRRIGCTSQGPQIYSCDTGRSLEGRRSKKRRQCAVCNQRREARRRAEANRQQGPDSRFLWTPGILAKWHAHRLAAMETSVHALGQVRNLYCRCQNRRLDFQARQCATRPFRFEGCATS